MAKQNIVIVGGGGAGVGLARELSAKIDGSKYDIVLISARDRYFFLPALLRMVVTDEGKLEENALVPLSQIFAKAAVKVTVKVGKATAIEDDGAAGTGGNVVLEGGEKISYRYLVLASGSSYEGPLAFPEAYTEVVESVNEWRKKIKVAKSVAVVGAGAVGLELAGEVKDFYPDTKVTVIHAEALPLNPTYPEKYRKNVLKSWSARGINFVLDDRIEGPAANSTGPVKTAKGKEINAELIIPTRGGSPNTAFLKSLGVLDGEGRVKVKPSLQVEGHPDIFAAGDILSWKEQKQLAKANNHIATIAANILALSTGKEPKKAYKGSYEMIAITNGRNGGAGYFGVLWGITLGDSLVSSMKSKELFVPKMRKDFGVAP